MQKNFLRVTKRKRLPRQQFADPAWFLPGLLLGIALLLAPARQADAASDGWKLTLRVSSGAIYGYCVAGVRDEATDGYDVLWDSRAMLSTLGSKYIYSYFPHPEWNRQIVNFSQDMQAPGPSKEWLFEVLSNLSGQLVVEWPDLAKTTGITAARIVDLAGGGTYDLHSATSFAFLNTPSQPRQFLLQIDSLTAKGNCSYTLKKNGVFLSWTPEPGAAGARYNIYRKLDGGDYELLNRRPRKGSTFRDRIGQGKKKLAGISTLYYKIVLCAQNGQETKFYDEITVNVGELLENEP